MGVEACVDGCMGEISLHDILFLFRLTLDGVELNPLPFDVHKVCVLCLQGVNVGYNSCIAKVEQSVVHYEAVVRGWVKDGKISVLQS
jgi:hypothetical protein